MKHTLKISKLTEKIIKNVNYLYKNTQMKNRLLTFEEKAKERAKKAALKKAKHEREVQKKKEARHKAALKRQAKKLNDWLKERQSELDKAYEMEMKFREKEKEKEKERKKKAAQKERLMEKKRKEKEKEKLKKIEMKKKAAEKAKRHEEAVIHRREMDRLKHKRYRDIARKKKKKAEANRKYYETHRGYEILKKRIETHDIPGTFLIVTAQDMVVKRKWNSKQWWNDALERYNELIEKNHSEMMCPADQIASSTKKTANTFRELLLLKKINPEVEDNITAFRDDNGKIVNVTTDKENWVVVLKKPWYVEEKFIVCGCNPLSGKKTAQWIGENFIEKDLSVENMKKVFLWRNFLIIDGDLDFTFAIGKTHKAARNLYMSLFKKYEKTDYVYFIGYLDSQLVSKWKEKIKEKTGWENLKRGKYTYHTKSSAASLAAEEIKNPIPTTSKSTVSTNGMSSEGNL